MKKLKLSYMVVACILFTVGCNDLLEEPSPATSLPGETVLTTEDGVNSLRASMYSQLRASFGYTTQYFIGPSAIADETRNSVGSTRFQGLNDIRGGDGGTNGLAPESTYEDTYSIILDANLMISGVEDGVLEDQSQLERYRGEAYAIRALAMHHLVRVLGYEPGQEVGGFDLGIVIRTEATREIADVDERPRATVDEVYTQILNDLSEAKNRLAGQTDNTRITEAFVDGLTARVNLYAGNWSAAESAASQAISNGPPLSNTEEGVAGMFDETDGNHPEALFKLVVDPNTEPIAGSNVNSGLAAYTSTVWVSQVPTQFVIDLYDQDDYRLGWYAPCFNDRGGSAVDCTNVNDENWEIQKWAGEKGQQADDIPYMRVAEMYLIHAEAAAKASGNYEDGLGPLNTLREARGLEPLNSGLLTNEITSLDELENEILDERVRELVVEGHRFFDLKRLGRSIPDTDGTTKIRYDNHRILDDFGASIISANPEIVENPGYREE